MHWCFFVSQQQDKQQHKGHCTRTQRTQFDFPFSPEPRFFSFSLFLFLPVSSCITSSQPPNAGRNNAGMSEKCADPTKRKTRRGHRKLFFKMNQKINNIYLTEFSGDGVQCSTGLPDRILLASLDTDVSSRTPLSHFSNSPCSEIQRATARTRQARNWLEYPDRGRVSPLKSQLNLPAGSKRD